MTKRHFLMSFLLMIVSICAYAQAHPCMVSGTVVTANDLSLPYASVYVLQQDSVITGTLTDQKGQFELVVPRSQESYLLTIAFVGY